MQHTEQQHHQRFLAGGNPQHTAVGKPCRLVHPPFQKGIGLAHGAAAAVAQRLPNLFPLQMVLHLPGFGMGVVQHRAVGLNPGNPEAFRFHGLQVVKPPLLRTGSGETQFIL